MTTLRRITDDLFLDDEQRAFRASTRRLVREQLAPNVDTWESERTFPRDVYGVLGRAGLTGVGFPEAWGGAGGGLFELLIVAEELTRSGSPGLSASLGTHVIALPPILNAGTDAQKQRWLPPVLRGEKIAALAVTEPGGGSDVASIRTTAKHDGDAWVVDGAKTFITSGTRADLLTVAVRTGGEGAAGISVLVVEPPIDGFAVGRNLDKLGWHASDTAELFFDRVRVPVENLVGAENMGFAVLMQNFATERLVLAAGALEIATLAWEAASDWAHAREAFGRPLVGHQVMRHKLADMATKVQSARAFVWSVAARVASGDPCFAEVAMAKNAATDAASAVVDEAMQVFGGTGYMRGSLVERLYRDVRLYPIGGGTREIMNEIISKTT